MNQDNLYPNQQPIYNPQPVFSKSNTGMIIWSVVNIIFCNRILGIIALVFSILANNATSQMEFDKNNKIAKILNIIATCIGALVILLIIAYIVFFVLLAVGTSM